MKRLKRILLNTKIIDFVLLDLSNASEIKAYYDLFVNCFGERSNINMETFEWFNLHAPSYNNMSFAFIDTDESRMISSYGLLPIDATVNGRTIKGALCNNVMTHRDYAGVGLFQMIGRESLEFAKSIGISFAFGAPNPRSIFGHLEIGWEIVNEIKFYENKPESSSRLIPSKMIEQNKIIKIEDYEFQTIFNTKYNFFFNRTKKWMNWRLNKPFCDYLTFTIMNSVESAFIVLKKYQDLQTNVKKLHIVDFGYGMITSFVDLIKYCQEYAHNEGFELINLWQYSFNENEVNELEKLGFIETKTKNQIIIHKLGYNLEIPKSDWHITLFDNDVY